MEKKTKVVSFNKLEEGMVVAKNVEQNGRILLKKDIAINRQMIKKIQNLYFIGNVEVYEEKAETKTVKKGPRKEEQYNKVEEEFKEISVKLQKTFRQLANENGIAMNEIREFSQRIQDELKPSSIVIKNIVLYGSGTDSIYRHGVNVAALSAIIGKWLGFERSQLNLLVYSAILHDFGKTKIDRELLKKESTLSTSEFNTIKTHAQVGYQYIKDISFLDKAVSYGVLMHHERLDGSGYPLGLKDEAIHPFAKIIAIADVFDAINSDRGYKKKKLPFEALQIVKNESLGKLDYEYSKIFLEHIIGYYIGEEVLLNTDERCKIIQMNTDNLEKPLVLKNEEFVDLSREKDLFIKEILL
ncbi:MULTISPECIES: HD-GYP domain-containing protein [unclassified Clostridium]|uniref:HD-GYP domain-containing protein n=1 Tax=unclassified Clostridium TaxID=2614128 RepID=UPI000297AFA0|nr:MULTISPECIES: HD-GYP domain-containing protein [unclassified Clostridium]EKQ55194.1 MAG: HD-GYP domain-containing protein [Clostridium sp. Maddingley MBC34-26]